MLIGIKFCGGCNPRYDRWDTAEKIMDRFADDPEMQFGYVKDSGKCDVLVAMCGCATACVDISAYEFDEAIMVCEAGDVARTARLLREQRDARKGA